MKFSLPKNCKEIPAKDPYMRTFIVDTPDGQCRVNVWHNNRNALFTVGTHVDHPKRGKNQLYRKHCSVTEVEAIIKNPRLHTGKGYR